TPGTRTAPRLAPVLARPIRSARRSLAARYPFPGEAEPIADGLLAIEGGRIATVEPRNGRTADLDLGNVAIAPGFVNAHTHLELSPIDPLSDRPDGTEDEVAWLRRVVAQRRGGGPDDLRAAIGRNLAATVAAGPT